MGTPGRGHRSYLQFGREATYGTAVAATHRVPILRSSVVPQIGVHRSGLLQRGTVTAARNRSDQYQGPIFYRSTIELELWYEGLLLILDGIMGTSTFGANGGVTTGANPYAHNWAANREFLNSYTMELIEGNIPSSACQRLVGAKMDAAIIRGSVSDVVCRLTLEVMSKFYQTNQTPTGGLNAVTALPVLFHEASTVDDGTADAAADVRMKNFEVTLRNHLTERHYVGSVNTDEPHANDFVEAMFRFKKEFQTRTMLDAVNAFTAGTPSLVFGSTASKRFTIQTGGGDAQITEYNHPIEGAGIIEQDVTWDTDSAQGIGCQIQIIAENTQATITT